HQSRLVEHIIPSNGAYQDTYVQLSNYFMAQGSSLPTSHQQALAWINQQVQSQASVLSYVDAFWVLTLISLAAIPLALTLRNVTLGKKASMGH
ncbi:MAG: DHA2 family efflux MFS transporter permease subunit, partial [Rhizobium sp.]